MSHQNQKSEFRRVADYPSRLGIWFILFDCIKSLLSFPRKRESR